MITILRTPTPTGLTANRNKDKSRQRIRRGPLRWEQSYRLLAIVQANSQISAEELQIEGASIGIEISVRTAFRFLERYRLAGGNIFKSARTHLQVVTEVLQAAPAGQLFSPHDLLEASLEHGMTLHLSTVYRILHKLVATGSVVQHDRSHKVLFEWNRQHMAHGRITCMLCSQTIEFEKDYLNKLAESICSAFDYQHERLELTLHAHCRRCREAN